MADILKLFLEISLMASVMAGVVLLIRRVFSKKMKPTVMLLLWGLVLLRLMLPFTLSSPVSVADLFSEQSPSTTSEEAVAAQPNPALRVAEGNTNSEATNMQTAVQQSSSVANEVNVTDTATVALHDLFKDVSLWSILGAVWIAGVVVVLFLFIRNVTRFRKKLYFCNPVADADVIEIMHHHKQDTGIKKQIFVLKCDFVHAPAVFGYFKPCILIPSQFINKMDRDSLRAILLHEICHIRRHDILFNYIWLMAKALHWFNPLVWIAYKRFVDDVELSRDQEAARQLDTDGRFVYSHSLVEAALYLRQSTASVPSLATSFVETKCKLKERILRLMKPHRKTKSSVIVSAVLALLMIVACFTTACQPTPEKEAVIGKNGLQDGILNTAEPTQVGSEHSWKYEKEYDSGNRLFVDAVMVHTDAGQLPVLSVAPKMFEDGEQLKKIVEALYPEAKVYEAGFLTKSQIQENIILYEKELHKLQSGLDDKKEATVEIIGGYDPDESLKEQLRASIEQLKIDYQKAPDDSDLKETSFELENKEDGSYQANMRAVTKDATMDIDFVNWETGSSFYLESSLWTHENSGIYDRFVTPESLEEDAGFTEAKERAEKYVRDMGLEYMSLNSVSRGEGCYSFYFARTHSSLQETYVYQHSGTTVTGVDGAPVIYLWKPEYLYLEIQNDEAVKVRWENPSEVIRIDNESVATKPWEEIQEIFKKQMDYLMSPSPSGNADPSNSTFFFEKTDVYINRVELGLTKVLMKDSKDDYKLIPTWSFLGYENSDSRPVQEGVNIGGEVCYLTINAIDGTVIDRGLMY